MPTIYNYDHLGYTGAIKDYSAINPGDTVRIPVNSILLRPVMKSNLDREKASMDLKARNIGCKVVETRTKQHVEYNFKKNEYGPYSSK